MAEAAHATGCQDGQFVEIPSQIVSAVNDNPMIVRKRTLTATLCAVTLAIQSDAPISTAPSKPQRIPVIVFLLYYCGWIAVAGL